MNTKINIHKNNNTDVKIKLVPSWKIPEEQKFEVLEFIRKARIGQVQEGHQLSERTLSKYLSLLRTILETINKKTSNITKEDIEKFNQVIQKKDSASDYRRMIKIFLKWSIGKEKTESIAGWLDLKKNKKTPDYLKESEVEQLLRYAKNPEERFLICVLFDSGARIEEFLNIQLEDIELPSNSASFVKITIKEEYSKTNGRTISLYWKNSLNIVSEFLEEIRTKGIRTPEGKLIPVRLKDRVFTMSYDAIRFYLARLGMSVLQKKINPHLFRHSSATFYASKLNRQELCYRYGWAFSSDMVDIYISRAGVTNKELDEKFKSGEVEKIKEEYEKVKFETNKKINEQELLIEELTSKLGKVQEFVSDVKPLLEILKGKPVLIQKKIKE